MKKHVMIRRQRRGAALVEYALLIAGVALVAAAAVAVFGHKTNDMIAAVASVLPGAHAGDNGPIDSGKLIETTDATGPTDGIEIDVATIVTNTATPRLGANLGVDTPADFGGLVLETTP